MHGGGKDGRRLHIMDNPIGVLANSPDFKWQMTNLRNYIGTAVTQQQEAEWDSVKLTPLDRGAGTAGLPGDFAPPARFVRTAAFKKSYAPSVKPRRGDCHLLSYYGKCEHSKGYCLSLPIAILPITHNTQHLSI